jgi:rhodanese-related sulfurtransferase
MPSEQAAVTAKKLGYTNIMVYPGGYPEWTKKGYEIER